MRSKILERDPLAPFLPDEPEYELMLAEAAYDYIRDAIKRGVVIGAAEIGIVPGFDVLNPEVVKFLQTYTALMSNRVNRTLVERVRAALLDGLEHGLSFREMRPAVLDALGVAREASGKITADKGARYIAERITRTEVARAQNAGKDAQLREAGAVRKVWRAGTGACEFCAAIDGMTIEADKDFFQQGESLDIPGKTEDSVRSMHLDYADVGYPPLHPSCLCVCDYFWE